MEDKSKILIIKSFRDEFENYYNYRIKREGVEVWNKDIVDKKFSTNWVLKQFQICFRMAKNGWIRKIRKYENIIIFDVSALVPWLYLFKRHNTRIVLWKWNIATLGIVKRIKLIQRMCEVWTFDKKDAEKYGWSWNDQFFLDSQIEKTYILNATEEKTIFFVGGDKGRFAVLREIYSILEQQGVNCDFYLVKDEDRQYDAEEVEWLKESGISYVQVIDHILQCDAILDLVQEGQTGLTLRVLEAQFYKKKLITNNKHVLYSDVYSADNIFIIDHDDWNDLKMFLDKPYQVLPQEILDAYSFDSWLERFK